MSAATSRSVSRPRSNASLIFVNLNKQTVPSIILGAKRP
jgi:hypothetical protein